MRKTSFFAGGAMLALSGCLLAGIPAAASSSADHAHTYSYQDFDGSVWNGTFEIDTGEGFLVDVPFDWVSDKISDKQKDKGVFMLLVDKQHGWTATFSKTEQKKKKTRTDIRKTLEKSRKYKNIEDAKLGKCPAVLYTSADEDTDGIIFQIGENLYSIAFYPAKNDKELKKYENNILCSVRDSKELETADMDDDSEFFETETDPEPWTEPESEK